MALFTHRHSLSQTTHRWRYSGTAAGLAPSTQLDISPVRGWGWRCWMKSVASTEQSGNTVRWREEKTLLEAAVSVGTGGVGTRSCTADRSTAVRLSWSGRSPAARAGGEASALRKEIKVGCSRFLCRWPPLKSRNPQEKTSACLQTCCSAWLKFEAGASWCQACSPRDGGQRSGAEGAPPLLK